MRLGQEYLEKGDLQHARIEFEAVHAARPNDLQAALQLGSVYIKMNRAADAADLLLPLEAGHENDTRLEYVLGFSLMQSGKATEGLPRLEKMAKTARSANAYFLAGATRVYRQEYHEARTDLEAALQLDPTIPGLYTYIGEERYALEDTNGAIQAFQSALKANPSDADANMYLGTIRLNQRDFVSARPLLELSLELKPKQPLTRLSLAKLNEREGKYAEAEAELQALVKDEPNWFDAHWELSVVYSLLNRPEDGKRERALAQQIRNSQQSQAPEEK